MFQERKKITRFYTFFAYGNDEKLCNFSQSRYIVRKMVWTKREMAMKSLNIKVIVLGAVLLLAACVDESAVNALDNVQLGMSSGSQDASGTDLSGGTSSNGFGDVALASSSSANAFDGAAGSNDAGDSGISSGDSAQQPSQPTSSDSSILPSSSANGAVSVPDVDDESASNEKKRFSIKFSVFFDK